MDYVQNVLARQRQLLSLLLLGREQETRQEMEWLRQAAYGSTQVQAAPALSAVPLMLREDAHQLEAVADGSVWSGISAARFQENLERSMAARRQAVTQARGRQYGQVPESGMPHMTGGGISGNGGARFAGPWSAAAVGVGRREAQAVPAAAGGAWQEAISARDVSLAFERDARRYDGGFSLY